MKKYLFLMLFILTSCWTSQYDLMTLDFDKAIKLLPELEQFHSIRLSPKTANDQIYLYRDSTKTEFEKHYFTQLSDSSSISKSNYLDLRKKMLALDIEGFVNAPCLKYFVTDAGNGFQEAYMGFLWVKCGSPPARSTLTVHDVVIRINQVSGQWYKCVTD